MKTKITYLLISTFICHLSSEAALHGQSFSEDIPYNIDIKKNIRNIKTINLRDIGKELEYIPLETTSECLIGSIKDVEFNDTYIFVSQVDRLLQFEINGKFIRQIGSQGRGPEEYLSVGDFCINNLTQEIYILSYHQILVFDFNGHLKRTFKVSEVPSEVISIDRNRFMFHSPNVPGSKSFRLYSWIITDKEGITLETFKNHLMRVSQPGLVIMRTPLYLFNNTPHFMEFGVDTLYYFQEAQKKPYAILNLENLKMDPDPLITPSTKQKVANDLFGTFWTNSIYENNDFLFIKFFRGLSDSAMCTIYNKKTDVVTILEGNAFRNDIDGGLDFWPKGIINDEILIDYVDAFDLLKCIKSIKSEAKIKNNKNVPVKLLNLSKQLTETSNPVLIILR